LYLVQSDGDKLSSSILFGSDLWFCVREKGSLAGTSCGRVEPADRAWRDGGADRSCGRAVHYARWVGGVILVCSSGRGASGWAGDGGLRQRRLTGFAGGEWAR
jgi:hypothetical protein